MQILLTGKPTSNHRKVSALLAYRLGLNYISAYDMVDSFCKSCGVTREVFDKHDDPVLDEQFNQCILARVKEEKDYVCDCLGISVLEMPGIKIFLDKDLFEETGDVSDTYEKCRAEQAAVIKMFGKDITTPDNYDIYINCCGKSADYLAQWTIDALINGTIRNRGMYFPAYACIPNTDKLPVSDDAYYKPLTEYSVTRFMCVNILSGDLTQAVLHAQHNGLCYVPFDNFVKTMAPPIKLHEAVFYEPWLQQTKDPNGVALLALMLAKYSHAMESYNYELAYTNFTINGNPVKRLIELGFHN